MTLKENFNRACNENIGQVLYLTNAQVLAQAVGSLISLRVPKEEILAFVEECMRVALLAQATSRSDRSADDNARALADALQPPLKLV